MKYTGFRKIIALPLLGFALWGAGCKSDTTMTINKTIPIEKAQEAAAALPFKITQMGAYFANVDVVGVYLVGPSDVVIMTLEIPETRTSHFEQEINPAKGSRNAFIHYSGENIGQYKSPALSVVPPISPDYEYTERRGVSGKILCGCKNLPLGISEMRPENSVYISLENVTLSDGQPFEMGPLEFRFILMPP